jgi:hypothetical protein
MSFSTVCNMESGETSLGVYCFAWLVMLAGIVFGQTAIAPSWGPHSPAHTAATGDALLDTLTYWDGQWYLEIASRGYSYSPRRMSSVAFFPAYPMLIRAVSGLTRLPPDWAALLLSQGFLAATYLLLLAYVRQRFPDAAAKLPVYVLLALGLFPPTFFMRMAYPESMFVFLTLLAMYGMTRNWRLAWIAAIVGLATATRLVGVALLLPLSGYAWYSSGQGSAACGTFVVTGGARRVADGLRRIACVVASMAAGLSGLLACMAYQWFAFGNPLAFVKAQDAWRHRVPDDLFDKLAGLASWDPLWLAYIPGSPGYARLLDDPAPAMFSLQFANPVFFVGAAALVFAGAWKGWLSRGEIALAAGLILIPYAAKGFEMCMASQARFVAAAFPIYIVLGHILSRLPRPGAIAILALFGAYLAIYSAMLAAGYVLI